jgi:hypothetical protein
MKEIKLKRKQIKSILLELIKASEACANGKPGAVMAQIWQDQNTGEVFADVEFIENERAGKVYFALNNKKPPERCNWNERAVTG